MKKKITSLALSAVLVLLAVFALNNEKIVNAADNLVLLEKRHPEYWMWLHCGTGIDLDGDNLKDVFVCPISKMYIDEIKDDYHLFLRDSTRSDPRRVKI